MTTYRAAAVELLEAGYEPIPIMPNSKRPAIKGWTGIDLTRDTVVTLAEQYADYGVGLRGGKLMVIDMDITDKDIVQHLVAWCRKHLGRGLSRIGQPPKIALFYQAETPSPIRQSATYSIGHIEARSTGTQTVAFGVHPATNQPYQWLDKTPITTSLHDLPVVPASKINALFAYLDSLCTEQGIEPDTQPADDDSTHTGEWMAPKYSISDKDLAQALSYLPSDDYHDWVKVGMALYHHYDGSPEGLELWELWSSRSPKFQPGDCETKWDTFHETGKRSTVTIGTILKLAQLEGWHNPGPYIPINTEDAEQQVTTADPSTLMERILTTEPPPVEWLIDGLLLANRVCLLVAPGGTGKSILTLQMAWAVATGTPFLDATVEQAPVLVLGAEDDNDDLHRRLHAIYKAALDEFPSSDDAIDSDAMVRDAIANLVPVSLVGRSVQLIQRDGAGHSMTPLVDKVIAKASSVNARLIIIDPLSRFGCGEEGPDMIRFAETLEHIRDKTGATILAVHHANKASMREGGADMQFAARGHSALTDSVRFQLNMASMHPDDAKNHGLKPSEAPMYVKLAVSKTNYSARSDGLWLRRGAGGVMALVDIDQRVQDVDEKEREALDDRLLSAIARYARAGGPATKRAIKEMAGENGPLRASRGAVMMSMERLIEAEKVILAPKGGRGGGYVLLPAIESENEEEKGDVDDLLDV